MTEITQMNSPSGSRKKKQSWQDDGGRKYMCRGKDITVSANCLRDKQPIQAQRKRNGASNGNVCAGMCLLAETNR